jgi:hypothetical protein
VRAALSQRERDLHSVAVSGDLAGFYTVEGIASPPHFPINSMLKTRRGISMDNQDQETKKPLDKLEPKSEEIKDEAAEKISGGNMDS